MRIVVEGGMSHPSDPSRSQLAQLLLRRWGVAVVAMAPAAVISWLVFGLGRSGDWLSDLAAMAPRYALLWAGVAVFGLLLTILFYGVLRNGVAMKPRDLRPINRRLWLFFASVSIVGCAAISLFHRFSGGDGPEPDGSSFYLLMLTMNGLIYADVFTPYRKWLVGPNSR